MGLAGLRQGVEYLKPSSGGGGRFTPYISWKENDVKTIAFVTPVEKIAKVKIHNFIKVPSDNERGFNWETFMCRKDPAWMNESNGECYICDVLGKKPQERHVAVAVELEVQMKPNQPVVLSAKVKTRNFKREDGTEIDYPVWGLVIQGFKNFYNYFTAFGQKYGSINHTIFDITRIGGDESTAYPITPLSGADVPDLSAYLDQIPSIEELLEKLGSKEKYDTALVGAEEIDQTSDFDTTVVSGDSMRTAFDDLRRELDLSKVESYS